MPTRLSNALYTDAAFARGKKQPIIDLQRGGQHGHMVDYEAWCSSTPYIRQPLIPRVITAPRGFNDLPNPQVHYAALKAIIELHSKSISGLTSTLEVESAQQAIGGAGEQIDVPTNVTRARSEPSHTVDEKYGRPITEFLDSWITNLIMDPETKYPNVLKREGVTVKDLLNDYFSSSVLYIEPDPTMTRCLHAWYVTNMYPTAGAAREGSFDLTTAKEDLSIDISFTGITQIGLEVNNFGQLVLDSLKKTNANPNLRPVHHHGNTDRNSPNSEAKLAGLIAKDTGFSELLSKASAEALRI